jgi:hypothetical protein
MTDAPAAAPSAPPPSALSPALSVAMPQAPPAPAAQPAPKAAPSAVDWANMTPQQRFESQQRDVDALNGTVRPGFTPGTKVDDATYAKMTHSEKVAYAESFQQNPNVPPNAEPRPATEPPADPNTQRIKIGDTELTVDEWRAAAIDKAARDVVRAALPDPSAYRAELPSDFKAPPGLEFTLNENDPLMAQARTVMHDIDRGKISGQEAFSKLLGLYAGAQVATAAQVKAGRDGEIAKLGASGTARVTSVMSFLEGAYGKEQGARMASRIFTAQDVQDWERVIQNKTSQGVASFSQKHRDIPDQRLSNDAYEKMSYSEKKDYAAKFSTQR